MRRDLESKEMPGKLGLDDGAAWAGPEAIEELEKMREALRQWLIFASDVVPGCKAGADWLDGLRAKTAAFVTPNAGIDAPLKAVASNDLLAGIWR